jgi:hypothetical protein
MGGPNGLPQEIVDLAKSKPGNLTIFERNLLDRISSVTMALYALTVQNEARRMQTIPVQDQAKAEAEIEATAQHAQDIASAALKMAGIQMRPRADAKGASG